jgi:hypothetical protein
MIGIIILSLGVLKPLLFKPVAEKYVPNFSSFFVVAWIIVAIVVTFPFMYRVFYQSLDLIVLNPWSVFAAVLKGGFVWGAVWSMQIINKKSTSSSVFFPFVSLSLASIIMNLFLDEGLKPIHLISIILLGILGGIYCFFGDARRMSISEKRMFFIAVIFAGGCSVMDHIGISGIGWYPYLVISNIIMLLFVIKKGVSKVDFKNIFTQKEVVVAGIFNVCYEILILASMVAIMPVSFVSFFMRLSAPLVMVWSAVKFKEQTVKNQLAFGCLALILALPMMFVAK